MNFEEMLANVRHNLRATDVPRVRKARHFEVYLSDPTVPTDSVDPAAFAHPYESTLRPLLGQVEGCRLFLTDGAELRRKSEPAAPSEPEQQFAAYMRHRVMIDAFSATYTRNLLARWTTAGATPEHWLREYVRDVAGEWNVALTPAVLNDRLFWWWIICGRSGVQAVLVTSPPKFDAGAFLAWTYDPFFIGGGEGTASWVTALRFAKRETARQEWVAFLTHDGGLYLSVVASAKKSEELFLEAVNHATLTKRLWARE